MNRSHVRFIYRIYLSPADVYKILFPFGPSLLLTQTDQAN